MNETYSYHAYGLAVSSCLPLPEFVSHDGVPEVTVCWGECTRNPPVQQENEWYYENTNGEAILCHGTVGQVVIRDGNKIVISPTPGVKTRPLQLFVSGVAFAVVIHQRGGLALHASAVEIDGKTIAFMGSKGCGKSSLSAALYFTGHRLITDDLMAVDCTCEPITVHPGYPQIKLTEETASALGCDYDSMVAVRPIQGKAGLIAKDGFASDSLPLGAICSLEQGPTVQIEPLSQGDAFTELLHHSLLKGDVPHFERCVRVASNVPFFRIMHPRSLSGLSDLAKSVGQYFSG